MYFFYFVVFLLCLSYETSVSANEQSVCLKVITPNNLDIDITKKLCGWVKKLQNVQFESHNPDLLEPVASCECEHQPEGATRSLNIQIICRPGQNESEYYVYLERIFALRNEEFPIPTAKKSSTITPPLTCKLSMCQCPSPVSTITPSETTMNTGINSLISDTPSSTDNVSEGQVSTEQPTRNKLVDSGCQDQKPLIDTIVIVVVVTSAINLVMFLTTVFVYRKCKLARITVKVKPTEQPNRKSNLESTQTQTRKRTNSSPKVLSSETDNSSAKSKTIETSKIKSRSITTATPDLGPDTSEIKSIRPLFLQAQQIKENPTPNPKDPNPQTTSRPITIETDIPTKTANKMNSKAEEWESSNENQNVKDLPIEIMKGILRHKKRNARK